MIFLILLTNNETISNYNIPSEYCLSYELPLTNDFNKLPWWIEQLSSNNYDHFKDHGYENIDLDYSIVPCITIEHIIKNYNIKELEYLIMNSII